MEKIVGLVITYFPSEAIKENIASYLSIISELIIIDNTPGESHIIKNYDETWDNRKQLTIYFNQQNYGIAKALNQGAKIASLKGYQWILTMDQDSMFPDSTFFMKFEKLGKQNLAIFAPGTNASNKTPVTEDTQVEVDFVMTSGNILNLNAWDQIGGFDEKLFIDEVDHDFCLRLKLNNYHIIQYHKSILDHKLGSSKQIRILGKKKLIFLHQAERTYYIFRNNMYMFKKYSVNFPRLMRKRKFILLKDFIKILLFSNHKTTHIKSAIYGIVDYKKGKFGPRQN